MLKENNKSFIYKCCSYLTIGIMECYSQEIVMQSQAFRAKFHPPVNVQRSYLVSPTHIVHFLFLWTQNLTNYYASSFPSHTNYSFNEKIPESYL